MPKDNGQQDSLSAHDSASGAALLPLPHVAQVLGVSRQRIYQLVKQRHLATVRVHGVLHLAHEDVQALSRERTATRSTPGRKRATPQVNSLPRAAKGLLEQVHAALVNHLLTPTSLDLFRTSLSPRLPLTMANWALPASTCAFLADAVALQRHADVPGADISLEEARQIFTLVSQALGREVTALPEDVTFPPAGSVAPRYVLADNDVIHFLTYGQGLRLAQSLLVFGRWGTGKARISAQLALLVAREVQRPLLYITTESSTRNAVALLTQVAQTLACDAQIRIVVGRAMPDDTEQLPVHVLRVPGDFSFVAQQLLTIVALHRPAVVILDNLDGLREMDQLGLDQLLKSLQMHDVLTILLAGEAEQPTRESAQDQAMSVCDVVLRTRVALPGGANAMESGLTTYAVELLRARGQRMADGRHLMAAQNRLHIYPALECWGVPELLALPTRTTRVEQPYHPGFSIPAATPHLAPLDAALTSQWMPGGALALHGGPRTSKDLLSLYACARAVQQGHSCLLLNLRAEYVPMLNAWMRETPHYDCFRVLAQVPCEPFNPETFGARPALQIWDINPCTVVPEQLLWQISRILSRGGEQSHRCTLFAWLHFSELLALPRFRAAQDFPVYAMRMLAGFGVSSVLNFDADNYAHTLRQGNIADFLPLTDVLFHLHRLENSIGEPTIDVSFRSGNFHLVQQQTAKERFLTAVPVSGFLGLSVNGLRD
jgi:KaiC/GvpD/RAD55 family RecA-like ATPase